MSPDPETRSPAAPTTSVRILAILAYTGFAIPVSIVAMVQFGLLGLILAGLLGWQWTRVAGLTHGPALPDLAMRLGPESPAPEPASSGNASFDAYRAALMGRLEQEQQNFEGFLGRLRDAKDQAEFDDFLEARARRQSEDLPDGVQTETQAQER